MIPRVVMSTKNAHDSQHVMNDTQKIKGSLHSKASIVQGIRLDSGAQKHVVREACSLHVLDGQELRSHTDST